jgi:hypothetical protein
VIAPGALRHQSVALPESVLGPLPSGPWSSPPREAVVICLEAAAAEGTRVVLIAALNPFRVLADNQRRFIELVAAQVSASLCKAMHG